MAYLSPGQITALMPTSLDPGIMETAGFQRSMIEGLGQESTDPLSKLFAAVSAPLGGALAKEAAKAADPIVQKLQPMIRTELDRQIPSLALWGGIGVGVLILIGVVTGIVTAKERVKARRR